MSAFDFGLRRQILFAPAIELARHIAFRLAEIAETARLVIDCMQLRADASVVGVNRTSFGGRQIRQRDIRDHATFDMIHHIERRADDARDLRTAGAPAAPALAVSGKRAQDAIFTFDQMRRRQQLAGRLFSQYEFLGRRSRSDTWDWIARLETDAACAGSEKSSRCCCRYCHSGASSKRCCGRTSMMRNIGGGPGGGCRRIGRLRLGPRHCSIISPGWRPVIVCGRGTCRNCGRVQN